jgi:hypothetical protein
MGRRVDRLITHIRAISENETANSTTDITDNEIIEYMNEAQHRLQSRILAQHPRIFIKETTITAVQDQEEYNLPADAFLANKILTIEYTDNAGSSRPTYHKLIPGYERNRASHISGIPKYYIRRDKLNSDTGSFIASPAPSSSNAQFRVTYVQRLDNLDKRRGIISAVTTTSTQLTALTLDTSGTPPIDSTDLADHEFFTIVGKDGTIKMRNVEFDGDGGDSINTSTGVVTLEGSAHTFESGETAAVGDYIVGGSDTTSHVRLPRNLERYIIKFAQFQVLKRDSSVDSQEAFQELAMIEQEILEAYQEIEEDIHEIAIVEEWD